jgi:hypothetical protein
MKLIQILLVSTLAGLCFSASAQWQWIDKDGRKVFSDRAPPADILDKNILKRPAGRTPAAAAAPPVDSAPESAASPAPAPQPSDKPAGLDKELEAKKKKAEEDAVTKRKADDERITRTRIENCARAKQAKATYESNTPLARINATGQREIIDDAARSAELSRLQSIMASDCR